MSSEPRTSEPLETIAGPSHGKGVVDQHMKSEAVVDIDELKYFRRLNVIMDRFEPTLNLLSQFQLSVPPSPCLTVANLEVIVLWGRS